MTTALLINDPEHGEIRVKVISEPIIRNRHKLVQMVMHQCNENWLPINILASSIKEESEEELHREIRAEAFEKGQFIEGESTNVELNPDYNEEDHRLPSAEEGTEE